MSMQYFPALIWIYLVFFWVRYSYVINPWDYPESRKNHHSVLFGLATVTMILMVIIYAKQSVPLRFAHVTFFIIALFDIVYQMHQFSLAYTPCKNGFHKYLYDNEKRFRLRVASGFSIFLAVWIMVLLFTHYY